MTETTLFPTLRRLVPDLLVGAAVFTLVLLATAGDATFASPVRAETTILASLSQSTLSDRHVMLILLAGVLSLLSTLNLAFLRHLVRTYAPQGSRKRCR